MSGIFLIGSIGAMNDCTVMFPVTTGECSKKPLLIRWRTERAAFC
jgi:hypothetical protein